MVDGSSRVIWRWKRLGRMKTVGNEHGKWSFRSRWRRPWLDGGNRSRRQLPRRMEAVVVDGTAPSADGGDSGRAATADVVAPVVVEGGQGGVAVADGGSSSRRRRRWRMEADGGGRGGRRRQWRMEAAMRGLSRRPWWKSD